jgi:ankyrin repeat protein
MLIALLALPLLASMAASPPVAKEPELTPLDASRWLVAMAQFGSVEQIQQLLAVGADVDYCLPQEYLDSIRDNYESPALTLKQFPADRFTALQTAAWDGRQEVVTVLLAAGASPNATGLDPTPSLNLALMYASTTDIAELPVLPVRQLQRLDATAA